MHRLSSEMFVSWTGVDGKDRYEKDGWPTLVGNGSIPKLRPTSWSSRYEKRTEFDTAQGFQMDDRLRS